MELGVLMPVISAIGWPGDCGFGFLWNMGKILGLVACVA